jgi:polysaccharide chain length determinant protein (PEP-CTERM system associated)
MVAAPQSSARVSAVSDYWGALKRRSTYVFIIFPLVVCACVLAAFGLKPQYQATASIMLQTSSVPKDIIESTVISYVDQQIEIVQGRVLSLETLLPIVAEIDPYPRAVNLTATEKAQKMLEDTTVERIDPVTFKPQAESNAFSLHYNNPNPAMSVQITNHLAQLFLTYNQKQRTEAAGEAAGFLKKQSDNVVLQMRDVDAQIAVLKHQYGDALPDSLARNESMLEDTQRQLDTLQQQILTAQEKESQLSVQLSQISPNLITQSGDLTDIATVRGKLAEAEQRYTPDHPEVKRLKHALETLMAQSAVNPNGIAPVANNPQYLTAEGELKGARNTLAGLQQLAAQRHAKLDSLRARVETTPVAEKAVSEIMRRKQALQNEYQQTQEKLQSATLAENFESQQGGERFTMLRAPTVPRSPVFPNRLGLILLGLVLGAALSGIAVAAAESMDHKIRAAKDLSLPQSVPLLASIPFIKNSRDRRRRAIMFSSYAAVYSLAAAAVIAVILSALHRR